MINLRETKSLDSLRLIIFTKTRIVTMEIYRNAFLKYLSEQQIEKEPDNLYTPIDYIMGLGGKRIRPVLVLMSCDLFGGEFNDAMEAALSVEMFHNFTLIHDDIMDKADVRRGHQTVHKKWDLNTGILSGDALMIMSNKRLQYYEGEKFKGLISLLSDTPLLSDSMSTVIEQAEKEIIERMLAKGKSIEEISEDIGLTVAEVKKILPKRMLNINLIENI